MTKTVFTNDMVGHTYAQQTQYEGRSGNGNFWFEGASLYSYRTIMNVFSADLDALFINGESYSVTSTQHVLHPYSMPGNPTGIKVFDCRDDKGRGDSSGQIMEMLKTAYQWTEESYTDGRVERSYRYDKKTRRAYEKKAGVAIVKALLVEAAKSQGKADRARTYKDMHLRDVESYLTQANWVRENMRVKSLVKMPDSIADVLAGLQAAKQRAKVEAEKRAAKQREIDAETFEDWKAGVTNVCPASYRVDSSGSVYMRIVERSDGGTYLQTSMHATVPLDHAKAAFRMAKFCLARGKGWARNGATITVGGFQVDSIDAKGNLKAGCHKLSFERMNNCAARHGLDGLEAVNVTA